MISRQIPGLCSGNSSMTLVLSPSLMDINYEAIESCHWAV